MLGATMASLDSIAPQSGVLTPNARSRIGPPLWGTLQPFFQVNTGLSAESHQLRSTKDKSPLRSLSCFELTSLFSGGEVVCAG